MNQFVTKCRLAQTRLIGISLTFVALLLLLSSCSLIDTDQKLKKIDESKVTLAIDTHVHLGLSSPVAKYSEKEALFYKSSVQDKAKKLQEEMSKAGVGMIFAMGQIGSAPDDPLGINENLKIAALVPGIKVIGAADPTKGLNREHMAATRAQIQERRSNIVTLKCYLGYMGGPEDPGYQPYYRLAEEFNLPVIFHTGDTWSQQGRSKAVASSRG